MGFGIPCIRPALLPCSGPPVHGEPARATVRAYDDGNCVRIGRASDYEFLPCRLAKKYSYRRRLGTRRTRGWAAKLPTTLRNRARFVAMIRGCILAPFARAADLFSRDAMIRDTLALYFMSLRRRRCDARKLRLCSSP